MKVNNHTTMTLIALLISVSIIPLVGPNGAMHNLHWESDAAVIHVLNGTMATFPWKHSSTTYHNIAWYYYNGTEETSDQETLLTYSEYKIKCQDMKRKSRLGFQNETGSAILMLDDVTKADEGYYKAEVIQSPAPLRSLTKLKVINVEDLTYTLSLNGTRDSSYNFSVNSTKNHMHLPPWGSTVIVPDQLNITVKVSKAGAPQPTIRIWKVANRKNHSQPNCHNFYCNRYVDLSSDDTSEASECLVEIEIEINFTIQNLKPLIHTFDVSIATASEGTSPSTSPLGSWYIVIIGVIVPLLLIIVGLLVYQRRKHWFQRKIRLKPSEEEGLGILLRSKSQHPEYELELLPPPLSPKDINVHLKSHPTWAEYSFDVPVDFNQENNDIYIRCLILITALLNTSGGVLTLSSYLEPTHDNIKHWQETFLKYALSRLSVRILRQHLVIDIAKSKMQIRVKKGPYLVTFDYNMVTWDIVAAKPAAVTDFEEVVGIVQCGEGPQVRDHVTDDSGHLQHKPVHYMDIHDFSESSLNSIWKELELVIQSLANSGGGTIDIRTNGSSTGCSRSSTSLSLRVCSDTSMSQDLKRWFTEKISEMVLIWGDESYSPSEGRDWEWRVVDNKVLRIFVYECQGGVFMRCPECYVITDKGTIRALSFKEWRNLLLHVTGSSEQYHQKLGVLEDFDQPSGSVFIDQSAANPGTDFDEPDRCAPLTEQKSLEKIQSEPLEGDKYSTPWSVVNSHWEKDRHYLAKPSADDVNHITSVLDKSSNIVFLPKSEQMNESSRETYRQVVQKINCQLSQGVCLTTPSWLDLLRNSQKYIHPEKQEILVISKNSGIYLCNMDSESKSNFHEKSQKKNSQEQETEESEHLMDTARVLKKYIVGIVSSESKDRQVNPAAFTIRTPVTEEAFPWREETYPSIIRTLVHLILLRDCLLRTSLIEMCTKTLLGRPRYPELHLSPSQSAVIHSLDTVRYIFVDGAPGSGKTLLALHICRILRSRSNISPNQIYYICPGSPLAAYVEYKLQGSCQVEHCPDLTKLHSVSRGLSKHAEDSYAIVDDSQNYVESNTHWSRVFNDLRVRQLVILVDSRYQNYTDHKGPQNLMLSFMGHVITKGIPYGIFQLGEAHRNTGKIFSFIRSSLGERETHEDEVDSAKYESSIESEYRRGVLPQGFIQHGDLSRCLQPTLKQAIPGGDVNFHEVPPGSDMFKFILSQILLLSKRSRHWDSSCVFNSKDIAVLFDNKVQHVAESQARELIKFLGQKGHMAQKADEFPVTKIIVDTLQRFQGLESKVVMFLLPPSGYGDVRHVHDARSSSDFERYRLLVTSRASHRVDFLYQGDHAGMMKKWLGFTERTPRRTTNTAAPSTSALIHQ